MMSRFCMFFSMMVVLCLGTAEAFAQGESAAQDPIVISADSPALIRLERDAASVIIGNPAHAVASVESPRLILVNPVAPGATALIILDDKGEAILDQKIIVNAAREGYVRINRVCAASDAEGCAPTSVYYCPDTCHPMTIQGGEATGGGDESAGLTDPQAAGVADGDGQNTAPASMSGDFSE